MKGNKRMDTAAKMGFLFAAPAVLYMLVFIGYPMIQNIILSFKNVDVYTFSDAAKQEFVGLRNYTELFTGKNSILSKAIMNTLIFTVGSIFFQLSLVLGWRCCSIRSFPAVPFSGA